jgi:hypothetical protein
MKTDVPLLPRLQTPPAPTAAPEPDRRITFRVSREGPPGAIRARRLLKYALRVLGLRNLKYEEIDRPGHGEPATAGQESEHTEA